MKQGIHPTYSTTATVSCACGNTFETGSTQEAIQTELCNQCHPFFTGTQKIIDSARRVEKFESRKTKKADTTRSKKAKETARKEKRAKETKEAVEKIAVEK
jgi:large subunit ribosomal protein L31